MAPVQHRREPRAAHHRVERGRRCAATRAPRRGRSATTPEGLANGTLSIHYPAGSTVSPLGVADPNGPATDAIAGPLVQPGEQCRQSDGPIPPGAGYTAYSPPLESTRTYVGIGHGDASRTRGPER